MGTTGYTVVIILLAGWFAWLMSRMAPYSPGGGQSLLMLLLGLGVALVVPLVILLAFGALDRLRSRRH
jgi:hypothetical protein